MERNPRRARSVWLGRRPYAPIHELQRELVVARTAGQIEDTILLLEHAPVITLGRGADAGHVIAPPAVLAELGISVVATGRGGDVTYHGPGQLVGYPILDLRPDRCDVRKYVRALAETMILIAREHGVEAGVIDDHIGVWVDRAAPTEFAGAAWARELAKVGAIGVRLSRWVTMHGFALNLAVRLADFALIVPCGIKEHPVASIDGLTGVGPAVRDVAFASPRHLGRALDYEVGEVLDLESAPSGELRAILLGERGLRAVESAAQAG